MLRNYLFAGGFLLGVTFSFQQSVAGPLTSAEVTKIINRVAVIDPAAGEHPANIREVIKDDLGLQTGEKSRSELLFQDNTLTRLGAETFFSFNTGTRDMTLEKGSMLLQVPKGLGGAKIHTAAVTAAITGTTIMMEYIPGKYIKVLVLEGSLRLSRNGIFGDSLVLRPGKMVIMKPDAKKIPEPVDVDIKKIVKTSSLVNFPDSAPLPSMALIQAAIDVQSQSLASKDLVPTNLVMGHGTDVIVASDDQLARIVLASPAPANSIVPVATTVPAATTIDSLAPTPSLPSPLSSTVASTTTPIVDSVAGTVASVPVLSLVSNTVPALDSVVATASSLPVLGSVTQTVTSLPILDSVTSSPILASITQTVTSLPILSSVTSAVTSTPILSSVTGTVAVLPTLSTITTTAAALPVVSSVLGTSTSLPVLPSITGSSLPVVGSLPASNSIVSAIAPATSVSPTISSLPVISQVTASAPTSPSTIPVSSSSQLLALLNTSSTPNNGMITIAPTTARTTASAPATTTVTAPSPTTTAALPTNPTTPATGTVTVPILRVGVRR
jgi:hypothetical protein